MNLLETVMKKCLIISYQLSNKGLYIHAFKLTFKYFIRHIDLEAEEKKEKQVRTLKKNLKLLMIALIVLAIEKLSEFITALISGREVNPSIKTKATLRICLNSLQLLIFNCREVN